MPSLQLIESSDWLITDQGLAVDEGDLRRRRAGSEAFEQQLAYAEGQSA